MHHQLPIVALLGRQNVGKSTLFNRLIEEPKAMVSTIAGTTRDTNIATLEWRGRPMQLVDTGGIEDAPKGPIAKAVRAQAEEIVKGADIICIVVDGQLGLTAEDKMVIAMVRNMHTPAVLVINKLDAPKHRDDIPQEILALGFRNRALVSAKNGSGTGDLLDTITELLPKAAKQGAESPKDDLRLIVLGRPNVGKSSLVNAILGEQRVIVSPEPHTTRDPQDTLVTYDGKRIRLVDTAGIRRKLNINKAINKETLAKIEWESVLKSLNELERADVAALVLDVSEPITLQERHIVSEIVRRKKGIVIVANKWDLVEDKTAATMTGARQHVQSAFPFLKWAPIVFVSALTKQRVKDILGVALEIQRARAKTIDSQQLGEFLSSIMASHTIVARKRGTPRALGVSLHQIGSEPPAFRLTVGPRDSVAVASQRMLMNAIRQAFGLIGTPVDLVIEKRLRR